LITIEDNLESSQTELACHHSSVETMPTSPKSSIAMIAPPCYVELHQQSHANNIQARARWTQGIFQEMEAANVEEVWTTPTTP